MPRMPFCPQIYQSLLLRGLSLVGWYHSHPHSPALPSLQDIDTQMDYQLRLQGSSNGFQPCLALLCCECLDGELGGGILGTGECPPCSLTVPPFSLIPQRLTTLAIRAPSPRSRLSG